MPLPPWPALLLFMALVLAVCVFIVVAAGHFPAEHRSDPFRTLPGAGLLWCMIILQIAAAGVAALFAFVALPWYAAVIGAGLMALIAPLLAQPLPDRVVDGRAVLLLLTLASGALAGGALSFLI